MSLAFADRLHVLDTLKGTLVLLVVLGHVLLPIYSHFPHLEGLFRFIYLFHMPLFVFASGFLGKTVCRDGHVRPGKLLALVVLAAVFQVLVLAFDAGGAFPVSDLVVFNSAPWYVLSLCYWYALTPTLLSLGARRALLASLLLAVVSDSVQEGQDLLAMGRTLSFLPFYTAGLFCTPGALMRVRRSRVCGACTVFGAVLLVVLVANYHVADFFIARAWGNEAFSNGAVAGIVSYAVYFAVACALCLGVVRLIPHRATRLGVLGVRSLQVYVLHRLIRAVLEHAGFYDALRPLPEPLVWMACIAMSIAIVLVCATTAAGRPFVAFMRVDWAHASLALQQKTRAMAVQTMRLVLPGMVRPR